MSSVKVHTNVHFDGVLIKVQSQNHIALGSSSFKLLIICEVLDMLYAV
jgi:hypothetical protein